MPSYEAQTNQIIYQNSILKIQFSSKTYYVMNMTAIYSHHRQLFHGRIIVHMFIRYRTVDRDNVINSANETERNETPTQPQIFLFFFF